MLVIFWKWQINGWSPLVESSCLGYTMSATQPFRRITGIGRMHTYEENQPAIEPGTCGTGNRHSASGLELQPLCYRHSATGLELQPLCSLPIFNG